MSPGSTRLAAAGPAPAERLDTLPAWPWDPFDREAPRTLGYHVWAWAEGGLGEFHADDFGGLVQPNGPAAGRPFRFTTRQITWLLWWYAFDEAGWLFHYGVRRLAKGSGKSPFAAVFSLAEFCAPVRLDRLDDRVPGGCRGRPVEMPWVQIAATAQSQTANTMRMVRALAPKGSDVVSHYGLDPGKSTYYRVPEGKLEAITSSVTATEGAEASAVVGDETEHWQPSNAGPELAATLEDNLAKSGSRMIETANAWVPGQGSVAEASWEAWLAQEEGRTRGETRILYDAVMAPPSTDLSDPDSLRAGLEAVYADCWWQDLRPIMERIWSPRARPSESKRKYLNWPSAAEDAWVEPEQWNRLADPELVVADGDEVVLFFDGSKSRDATALIGCRVSDGHVFTCGVWEPDGRAGETVDVADVDRVLEVIFERLRVSAFFADVREWESYALTAWPRRFGDQLKTWAVPKGRPPQQIAWDMRAHTYEFAKACEAVEAEIVEGSFTHDGDSRVARHVANARRRPHRDAVGIGKESKDSPRKIDAAVCVVGARMVRRVVLSGKRPKSGRAAFH